MRNYVYTPCEWQLSGLIAITFHTLAREAALSSENRGATLLPLVLIFILGRQCLKELRNGSAGYRRGHSLRDFVLFDKVDLTHEHDVLTAHNVQTLGDITVSVAQENAFDCILKYKIRLREFACHVPN